MAKSKQKGIDGIYTALRPRLRNLAQGVGGVTVVIPAHTHAASQITFDPNTDLGGFIDAFDVQTGMEELDTEKLARSGAQPMLGALDMNHFNVDNVDNLEVETDASIGDDLTVIGGDATISAGDLVFSGAIGSAQAQNVRIIVMEGAATDDEAKIENLERLLFNNTDGYSVIDQVRRIKWAVDGDDVADYGDFGWSAEEHMAVVATELADYDNPDPGTANAVWPMGWNVTRHIVTGIELVKGMVVNLSTLDADYTTGAFALVEAYQSEGLVDWDLGKARRVIGVALHNAKADEPVWVLRRGRILPTLSFAGSSSPGAPVWADPDTQGGLTFTEPTSGQAARVLIGHLSIDSSGEGPFWIDVDVRPYPTLMGASWVKQETPSNLDVLRYDANDVRWERKQLFPSQTIDSDYTLTQDDYLVRCVADSGPFTVYLPAPSSVTGAVFVIRREDDAGDSIVIDAVTNGGTIDGEDTLELLVAGESITVQSDGSSWAVI